LREGLKGARSGPLIAAVRRGKMTKLNKTGWCLLGCLIAAIGFFAASFFAPRGLTGLVRAVADNDLAGGLRAASATEFYNAEQLTEVSVEDIAVSENDQPVVILKTAGGERFLPIWIGILEANAIAAALEGIDLPRPLTADLLCSVLTRTGAKVNSIVIYDLRDETYYAHVILYADWTSMVIDARPSDALAIALRVKAPIYVTKELLQRAGISPDEQAEGRFVALPTRWSAINKSHLG